MQSQLPSRAASIYHDNSLNELRPPLSATYELRYDYKRSLGPVLSAFFTGLREGRILGARCKSGRVLVPPSEYDPDTGNSIRDLVEVGSSGVVTAWSWTPHPRANHILKRPFAWGLIQLDGAHTSLVHVVDAGSRQCMRNGMRVCARWAEERCGYITDIACFVPEEF